MFSKTKREYAFFKSHPRPMRMLLMTNFTYALVLPVIELFIGAYIMRNSSDISLVVFFQLAQYTGIPITFAINAFLLNRFHIARIYAAGMFLSGISMSVMMLLNELNALGVSLAGLIMGLSYGFFWGNRVFLALTTTKDENRNYYYGLETFLYTLAFVAVPFFAGMFIGAAREMRWFGGNANGAYYVLTGGVFILLILASILLQKGKFKNPKRAPFLYFKFHPLWRKMLLLAPLKGVAQGYIISAPVMLIMRLVGQEGALGSIQSTGALLSAIMLYFLGRKTQPRHRLKIYAAGLSIFVIGAFANTILYSAAGVIIFVACLIFARPLMDLAYFPIQLGVIEFAAARENRNEFAYIFSHEVGLYVGRVFGCLLFIALARFINEDAALRYALPVIAGVQFLSIFMAKSIVNDRAWQEPVEQDLEAVDVLKEPMEL